MKSVYAFLTALFFITLCGVLSPPQAKGEIKLGEKIAVSGDARGSYVERKRLSRAGIEMTDTSEWRARIRLQLSVKPHEKFSIVSRWAGRYSTEDQTNQRLFFLNNDNDIIYDESTIDKLYMELRPNDQWTIRVGRLQTKFELEGVAKKSLDRNDSPNVDIDWTDGGHIILKVGSAWKAHLILQYNGKDGASNVLRSPLNFTDSGSRITYVAALESKKKAGPFVQRGIDVTYIPKGLRRDGTATGRIEDYLALVGRTAVAWPTGIGKMVFQVGAAAGYAFNQPTKAAVKLNGGGDAGGFAGQVSVNLLDIYPKHSIGVVYGYAQGGWLVSPDFRRNEDAIEGRYKWQVHKNVKLEARYRQRQEIKKRTGASHKQRERDLYVRMTAKF